ncbi:hypothetical protein Tco_0086972 [Tanacetum coccineum]
MKLNRTKLSTDLERARETEAKSSKGLKTELKRKFPDRLDNVCAFNEVKTKSKSTSGYGFGKNIENRNRRYNYLIGPTHARVIGPGVGDHSKAYQTFDDMLKKFDRDDLEKLWSLVNERFSSTDPIDDKERILWVELKRLFGLDIDDILGHDILMLVEKDYPLTRGLMTVMLDNKLQVDQSSEMANELLRKIFIQAERPIQ